MPVDTLLTASVELMFIGMGAVFLILGLLIGCMTLLGQLAPTEEPVAPCSDDKTMIAAIQAAIHNYRNNSVRKTTA